MFSSIVKVALVALSLASAATTASAGDNWDKGGWDQDHCLTELQLGYASWSQSAKAHKIALNCHKHLKASDPVPFGKHKGDAWGDTYGTPDTKWATHIYISTQSWSSIANTPRL